MGLAASQARLLSITSRLSDNELRAQIINNQKMRLSADSSKVSENYINALNKTNLVFANYDENDKAQNVPLTFKNLTAFNQYNNQYGLTNTAGNILVSESDAEKYRLAEHDQEKFLKQYGIEYTTSYWDTLDAQLRTNESFYSNPDGDGVAEQTTAGVSIPPDGTPVYDTSGAAKFTAGGKETGNETTDGVYNFFDSAQLRIMYEGGTDADGNTIKSYEETIKTKEYTDFSGYIDSFALQAAALKRANAEKNQLLEDYAQAALTVGQTFRAIDALTSAPTAADINDINTKLQADINKYYDGVTYDSSTMAIPTDITASFSSDSTYGYIDSTIGDYFGDEETKNLYSNGYDKNSLYLQIGTNYYARVEGADDSGNSLYANVNATGTSKLYYWDTTTSSMKIYESDGNTPEVKVNRTGTALEITYEEKDDAGTVMGSQRIQYPSFNTTSFPASGTSGPNDAVSATFTTVMPKSEFLAAIKATLKAEALQIFADIGRDIKEAKIKESEFINSYQYTDADGNTETITFSDADRQKLLSQTETDAQIGEILENICDLLFGDKNKIKDPDDMAEFLDIIMSGNLKDFMEGRKDIVLNNTGTPITIESNFASKDIEFCVNAYILDTMMDLFGEPVYGYMKGGKDNWKVANEEANWYINLFNKIEKCGYQMLPNGLANSTDWIQFALENGIVIMEQIDSVANWQPINYTSCSDIIEKNDSTAVTIAEAEYNKAMRQIQAKDEMFDLELKNIDTEHSSLQSEYESVKKAMSGNIDRTFQMYS